MADERALTPLEEMAEQSRRRHPGWRIWQVPVGTSAGDRRVTWCAYPHPELELGSQSELSKAITSAMAASPLLRVVRENAGFPQRTPLVIPETIPPGPSLTLLDQERAKLQLMHPGWRIVYYLRRLDDESLQVTWCGRPEPTLKCDRQEDLDAEIAQISVWSSKLKTASAPLPVIAPAPRTSPAS
jgi:hypothetical protein